MAVVSLSIIALSSKKLVLNFSKFFLGIGLSGLVILFVILGGG